jgi:predicted Zn-dependent protease
VLPMLSGKLFDIPVVLLDVTPEIPEKAYEKERKKYYAGTLLDYIETLKPAGSLGIIGFVNEQIFAGPSPFVDGIGLPDSGTAVVSLAQIKNPDYYIFRRRTFSEALHELGHVVGLDHDVQPYCVMQETHELGQLDARATDFCPFHAQMAYNFLKEKIPTLKPFDPFKGRQGVPVIPITPKAESGQQAK